VNLSTWHRGGDLWVQKWGIKRPVGKGKARAKSPERGDKDRRGRRFRVSLTQRGKDGDLRLGREKDN